MAWNLKFMNKSLLAAVSLGLLLLTSCQNDDNSATPVEEIASPLDYSVDSNWVDIEKNGTKPVDIFYIYPTIVDSTRNEDGFADVDEMRLWASIIRVVQTSAYENSGNIYMPFYRQAVANLAETCNKDNQTFLDLLHNGKAYSDIEAALDYYFENYNKGKPFILAGHSQGSAMLINVLTYYMQEHKDLLKRMVAAYAIGFAPSEDIFNDSTGLKFATGEDDYNVVVSFTTEGPSAEGKSILLPEHPMVINPLNWKTDTTYAPASMNKGSIEISPDYDSITEVEGEDDAQINMDRKTVVCTTKTSESYTVWDEVFSTESFHEREYFMYYGNIKDNVKSRVESYFADK